MLLDQILRKQVLLTDAYAKTKAAEIQKASFAPKRNGSSGKIIGLQIPDSVRARVDAATIKLGSKGLTTTLSQLILLGLEVVERGAKDGRP